MKTEILKYSLAALIGAFIYAQFSPTPSPQPPVVAQQQLSECQVIVKKTINPDGSVDEITEFLSKNSQKQEIKPQAKSEPKNYGIGVYNDKTLFGEVRLGRTDLFIIAESNLKEHRIGLKLEF